MVANSSETRARILEAADTLFYSEGVLNVGVDAIAAQAGVTKRTLYYHFRSKDDLIAAYLEWRNEPTHKRYRKWAEVEGASAADKIATVFARLGSYAQDPRWKGCGFSRAAAELAGLPGHPALAVAAQHKREMEASLRDIIAADGVEDTEQKARQVMILLEGTISLMLIHHDTSYTEEAARAVRALLKTKTPKTKTPVAAEA